MLQGADMLASVRNLVGLATGMTPQHQEGLPATGLTQQPQGEEGEAACMQQQEWLAAEQCVGVSATSGGTAAATMPGAPAASLPLPHAAAAVAVARGAGEGTLSARGAGEGHQRAAAEMWSLVDDLLLAVQQREY